jgi:hypothetical protein
MFKINKVNCSIKPKNFESLNNGIWYYNFDIESNIISIKEFGSDDFKEETRYNYGQVRISGTPTLNKCYEAVLKAYIDESGTSLYNTLNSPNISDEVNSLVEDIYEMV